MRHNMYCSPAVEKIQNDVSTKITFYLQYRADKNKGGYRAARAGKKVLKVELCKV